MRFAFLLLLCPVLVFGQAFSFQDLPFLANAGGTDWENRVIANGGAQPSANTVTCMERLRLSLIELNLTNSIYSMCVFVPDSVIAASTPLFKHKGSDPWVNSNFAASNLTVEGLKGDGTSKSLDTGVSGTDAQISPNVGVSLVITESNSNAVETVIGAGIGSLATQIRLLVSSGGTTQFFPVGGGSAPVALTTNDFVRVGYVSANQRTNGSPGVTNQSIFVASELEPHRTAFLELLEQNGTLGTTETISVFALKQDSTNASWSGSRMSMAAVHFPWTPTESSNFWWAVKTCRECLGGGVGNPVKDWSRRLVELGGPTISTTSSNALTTFYSGLAVDGFLESVITANCYLPDNLFASRTPFIWQAGSQVWTNFAFGETNLTVNGLTGNGTTKYLGTGIHPSVVANRGFGAASAGVSLLIFNTPSSAANMIEFGGQASAPAGNFLGLGMQVGLLTYYCWATTTVNTDFARRTVPVTNYAGFLSGNRTAANAIRLDWVTNGVHNIATNGAGVQAANPIATNVFAGAVNVNGTVANVSDRTLSFAAVHRGFTQAQSSNFWWRVANLRTNLGGGVP